MPAPKAAIIAIGSELLSGQILNRNAAWISERLNKLGLPVVTHVTVDDVQSAIVNYLNAVAQDATLIFLTGGLGPTSDDLTRDAVAVWAGESLVFHEPSWTHVQQYFAKLNLNLPVSNRQQCFFPASAQVLTNERGTANAFTMTARGRRLWVLPGPPREVEGIWDKYIASEIAALVPAAERRTTKMWRTVGRGESAIAELVEPLVAGPSLGLVIAYRAHAPVIETKLSYTGVIQPQHQAVFKELDRVLEPWLFEKDDENTAARLARRVMAHENVIIYDGLSQGFLQETLTPYLRQVPDSPLSIITAWDQVNEPAPFLEEYLSWHNDAELALAIAGYDGDSRWAAAVKLGDETKVQVFNSPYIGENLRERNRKAVGALAMKAWLDVMDSLSQ